MPFAGYDDFDDCVSANSDKDDPDAYCAVIKREVEGEAALSESQREAAENMDLAQARMLQVIDEGDAVMWDWQGSTVHGRVNEVREESATVDGVTITGDDDEPVYIIDEYDEEEGGGGFKTSNVAKPESSLNESTRDLPDRTEENMLASDCPEGYAKVGGECVKIDETENVPPSSLKNAQFTLASLKTEPIERTELSNNKVKYSNVKVLESGTWTDSGSKETIWYSPRGLENLDVRDNNSINIAHDADNEVSEVGEMQNAHAEDGELFADLVIDTSNAAGEYADENLQATLESEGDKGFGGPSVEIDAEGQEIEYNDSRGLKELVGGYVSGLGLVANPASKPVAFDRQVAERGVAMSEAQTHYTLEEKPIDMADIEEVRETLDANGLGDVIEDMTDEEVMDMAENLHGDLMEDLQAEEYEDEEEEEEEKDMEMSPEEMEEMLETMMERVEELENNMMGMDMAEELADADTVEEVEARLSDVEETTKKLSEEPKKPRSMSDNSESIFSDGRRMSSTDSAGTTSR